MVNFTPEQAVLKIKEYQTVPLWVIQARERRAIFDALVSGNNFTSLLEKIEHVETDKRAIARKKYSKDIRDLFSRVFKKRQNVFEAVGGSEVVKIDSEPIKQQFISYTTNFKGNKSIEKYLQDTFFNLLDIDPNGLIFMEYKSQNDELEKIYPTYKSINDIRYYEANGQTCDLVIFEPKKVAKDSAVKKWRFVDSVNDYTFLENGGVFTLSEELSFVHPFGQVPAVIISETEKVGEKVRISPIDQISELAKDYARDKSVLTIYKFQNGFPIHWRYIQECKSCRGIQKEGQTCQSCGGSGYVKKNDVTDVVNLQLPQEGDPIIAPNVSGFISPDLKTWEQYINDLKRFESMIEHTVWGTVEAQRGNETATGKFIDTQPITNELSKYSSNVEYVHNTLARFVLKAVNKTQNKNYFYYHSYGRRFIIDSPDVVMKRYDEAKTNGDPVTVLDRLLNEWIVSKFKGDNYTLAVQLKKVEVEPYVHYSIKEVFDIFGQDEAKKKIMFSEFWKDADYSKSDKELRADFEAYTKK
jgi:hypothetical protein